jgi:hypothetical protein
VVYNTQFMEATLGISRYSYLYLKLAKMLCLSYYLLCFLFNKIGAQEGGTGGRVREGMLREVKLLPLKHSWQAPEPGHSGPGLTFLPYHWLTSTNWSLG